jgi:hypothetical protein
MTASFQILSSSFTKYHTAWHYRHWATYMIKTNKTGILFLSTITWHLANVGRCVICPIYTNTVGHFKNFSKYYYFGPAIIPPFFSKLRLQFFPCIRVQPHIIQQDFKCNRWTKPRTKQLISFGIISSDQSTLTTIVLSMHTINSRNLFWT